MKQIVGLQNQQWLDIMQQDTLVIHWLKVRRKKGENNSSYRQIETYSEEVRSLATASYIVNNVPGRKVQTEIRKKVARMEHPDERSVITYNGKSHDLRLEGNNAAKQRKKIIICYKER